MPGDWIAQGHADVFTTCRDCGTLMKVVDSQDHSHPTCVEIQTELEGLADLYAMEIRKNDWTQAQMTAALMDKVKVLDLACAAVQYTEWEWPVFPLGMGSKIPAIPKRKGGKGFKDATTDTARIDKWWSRHPDHNIGLATGHMFDVIDIDTKDSDGNPSSKGVMSFLNMLEDNTFRDHSIEIHGVAVTASGGMHLYVPSKHQKNYAGLRPGIDYRALGGYVVAPPSTLRQPGRDYTWLVEPSPIIKGGF